MHFVRGVEFAEWVVDLGAEDFELSTPPKALIRQKIVKKHGDPCGHSP